MEIKFSENQKFLCSDKEKIFEVNTFTVTKFIFDLSVFNEKMAIQTA